MEVRWEMVTNVEIEEKGKGKLVFHDSDERAIIIPRRAYAAILDAIIDIAGPGASGPLYRIGKRIGEGLLGEMKTLMEQEHRRMNIEDTVKTYIELLESLGFGKIEIVDLGDESATIKMYEPPSMTGIRKIDGKVLEHFKRGGRICFIEAGMIAAVFEGLLGGKFRGVEVEHGGLDDPYCIIKVERIQ